jgi:hypothetical protein
LLLLLDDNDGENERGTVRVIPSARLDPCPCVCDGGGCADINVVEVEIEVAAVAVADVEEDVDVDLPCRASESVFGTADAGPFRTSFTAGGSGVGAGCGCRE